MSEKKEESLVEAFAQLTIEKEFYCSDNQDRLDRIRAALEKVDAHAKVDAYNQDTYGAENKVYPSPSGLEKLDAHVYDLSGVKDPHVWQREHDRLFLREVDLRDENRMTIPETRISGLEFYTRGMEERIAKKVDSTIDATYNDMMHDIDIKIEELEQRIVKRVSDALRAGTDNRGKNEFLRGKDIDKIIDALEGKE